MHLLYLIDSLVPGGAERSLAAMAPHFIAAGLRLDVAFLNDHPGLQDDLLAAGAELFNLAGKGGRLQRIRRVTRLLSSRRPNLLHTTLFEADLAGRVAGSLSRIPVVSSLVNISYGREQISDPRLHSWKVRAVQAADIVSARAVVRFHALSQHLARVMSRRLIIPLSKIDVIPRGRDPKQLGTRTEERRNRTRAAISVQSETPLIVAASRQEYQKGLDILLRAFRVVRHELPPVQLIVAGREGNHTPTLRSLVKDLSVQESVRFLGPRRDVPDLLSAADVFCLPSRWEGLGSVVLEAMALEAPIVASDLPPIREVTGGDRGARFVPVGDPAPLAGAIVEMLKDPARRAGQTREARERFLRLYTASHVAREMVAFYQRALPHPHA